MNVTNILSYLSENKAIILGAALTISELVVIIVNMSRKLAKENTPPNPKLTGKAKLDSYPSGKKEPLLAKLIWSVNPINLFRKV